MKLSGHTSKGMFSRCVSKPQQQGSERRHKFFKKIYKELNCYEQVTGKQEILFESLISFSSRATLSPVTVKLLKGIMNQYQCVYQEILLDWRLHVQLNYNKAGSIIVGSEFMCVEHVGCLKIPGFKNVIILSCLLSYTQSPT